MALRDHKPELSSSSATTQSQYGFSSSFKAPSSADNSPHDVSKKSDLIPSVTKPSGGGTIKGMNEAFSVDMVSGTAGMSIPIPSTPISRWGSPDLSLSYDSGAGNGPFGIGWNLKGIPTVQRSSRRHLPRYNDQDVFEFAGAELVPVVSVSSVNGTETPDQLQIDGFTVQRYRPRVDNGFDRVERWTNNADGTDVHWRVLSPQNETHIFGRTHESRVFSDTRTIKWLLCEAYDTHGGGQLLRWKSEDGAGIDESALHELNRTMESRSSYKYLKSIKYGNSVPNRKAEDWNIVTSASELPASCWHFELVLDYGDHDIDAAKPDDDLTSTWAARKDPFSSYGSGFEMRTYRLCQRILMFHHFEDKLKEPNRLVSQLTFEYNEDEAVTFLSRAQLTGFAKTAQGKSAKSLPPLEFEYTKPPTNVQDLTCREFTKESTLELGPHALDRLQWVDLVGDGTTGALFQDNGSWYWKPNLSQIDSESRVNSIGDGQKPDLTASLGEVQQVPTHPSLGSSLGSASVSLADVDGDGKVELVSYNAMAPGYYRSNQQTDREVPDWQEFKCFESWPNINLDDANVRMIDLTGNGLADILVTEDDRLVWYYSHGTQGFGPSETALHTLHEEKSPRVIFSDLDQSIYLADLSGDGLVDIVRIRNGDICYWPNLGYGRFGSKVSMSNSPVFDHQDVFSHAKVILCDVDGSGTTDIIYFKSSSANLYRNNSGNYWADGISLGAIFPDFDSMSKVTSVDLFGTGTTCLVWFSNAQIYSQPLSRCLMYVDLMEGVKPYILKGWKNNQGHETSIVYRSSTSYYLEDKKSKTPWVTTIPFPIQCVDTVMQRDLINRTLLVDKYSYHHGYYDGIDREFHGFGRVDHWNSEESDFFDKDKVSSSLNILNAAYTAPVHTKTWYHVGAFEDIDMLRSMYAREFNQGIVDGFAGFKEILTSEIVDAKFTAEELREASQALKGAELRKESYGSSKSTGVPYMIQNTCTTIKMTQKCVSNNRRATFQTFQSEIFTTSCEGDVADASFQQELNLEVDDWGNVTKAAKINYGRLKQQIPDKNLSREDIERQEKMHVVYKEASFTLPISEGSNFLAPLPCSEKVFEVTGLPIAKDRYQLLDFAGSGDFSPVISLNELKYTEDVTKTPCRRLISSSLIRYKSPNLKSLLDSHIASPIVLAGQSWTLCLTSDILSLVQDSGPDLTSDSTIFAEAGYQKLGDDGCWWIPSPDIRYGLSDENELTEAQSSFFVPKKITSAFNASSETGYDPYFLMPVFSTDAVGNKMVADIDYHYLAPTSVTDINGNTSEIAYDALGRIVAIAESGRGGTDANTVHGVDRNLSVESVRKYFQEPLANARSVLSDATMCYLYDDSAYMDKGTPASVSQISAVYYGKSSPRDMMLSISYQDSSGRVVQTKAPTTNGKWRASGWNVYNNKGLVVQTFDPFLDDTPYYKPDNKVGNSSITFYDALDREVAIIYPDHTWTKTTYRTWSMVFYDKNDLCGKNPADDTEVGAAVASHDRETYLPTWYDTMNSSSAGPIAQAAAKKSMEHQNTPTTTFVDSMGKEFLVVNTMSQSDAIKTRKYSDVQGYEKKTIDARNRVVTRTHNDMLGRVIKIESMDRSPQMKLPDVDGRSVYQWTTSTDMLHFTYDKMRRPFKTSLIGVASTEATISENIYGDSLANPDPKVHNLRGQLHISRDQAGEVVYSDFEISGKCIMSKQKLAASYNSIIDWNHEVKLEGTIPYENSNSFDALGRVRTSKTPDGTTTKYDYDINGLLFSVKTERENEELITYISKIEYDEHLREVRRDYAQSGVTESKKYDPRNHHLSEEASSLGTKPLQHFVYTYDAVGNVVYREQKTAPEKYFRETKITGDNDYTYDSINRLVVATGREHIGQTRGQPYGPAALKPLSKLGNKLSSRDKMALANYTETYTYDMAGNMEKLQHQISDKDCPGWTRYFKYENPSLLEPAESKVYNNRLSWSRVGKEGNPKDEYKYDGNGNIITMPSPLEAQWDFKNQLQCTTSLNSKKMQRKVWYVYNDAGQRIRKVVEVSDPTNNSTRILRDTITIQGVELYTKYNGQGSLSLRCETLHVSDGHSNIALVERWSGPLRSQKLLPLVLHRVQLRPQGGSVTLEMDEDGQIITHEEYSPFGSQTYFESWTKSRKRYGYSSKERDKETSLLYFGKRYYIPWLCRWLNPDPLGTADGLNVYQYVHNNPINLHDPEGTTSERVGLINNRMKKKNKSTMPKEKWSRKLKREQEGRSEGKAEARDLIRRTVKTWSNYVSDPGTIERYAPTVRSTKPVSRRKIQQRLAEGASFIRGYNPEIMHNSHLIPHEFKGPLENIIDVDSWCVSVPGWVNTGPMASRLDKPWRNFFAAPVTNKPNAMTTLEFFAYIGLHGDDSRKLKARNILLSMCKRLVESSFFTWDTVLEYRVEYKEKNIAPEYHIKPKSWYEDTGSPYIPPGPRPTDEAKDFLRFNGVLLVPR